MSGRANVVSNQKGPAAQPRSGDRRWLHLSGVWLVYFSFGIVAASMAPIIPEISADLNIDNARMGFILGAWPLVYLVAALPGGMLLDIISPRASLLIAGLVIGASSLARAFAPDELFMFLAVALFGIGGPLISVGAPKLIAQLFEGPSRGLAMGIYLTGPSIGTAAALALTNSVMMPMTGNNWRMVLVLYGLLGVLSGLYWFIIAGQSHLGGPSSAQEKQPKPSAGGLTTILAMPVVQLILLIAVGMFFINHALNNWLPEILRANGLSVSAAGYVAAVPTLVGIAGSLIIPRLAIPARRMAILIVLFAVSIVSALLLHSANVSVLLVALLIMGVMRGAAIPIATLILIEARGIDKSRHGLAVGLFFAAGEVGGVLGPVSIGLLSDYSGNFSSSINAIAVMAVAMTVLAGLLLRVDRNRPADKSA